MNSELLAKRFLTTQERLLTSVLPKVDHTSAAVRQHLQNGLTKSSFNTKAFLRKTLAPTLSDLMFAGHIAGIKEAQQQAKRKKIEASFDLELSILSSAIEFAQRVKLNFKALREKYKTLAFQVVDSTSKDINEQLLETVQKLIKEGAHVNEAKQVLAVKFDQLGLRPANRGQFETIFRTQLQIAFSAGKYTAETANPRIYNELWGYKYITTEDSRVRPTHAILDGVTLPKDHPFWDSFYPPNGYNCRCQAIPLFEPQQVVEPPKYFNGHPIAPDKGFDFKAGTIFNALAL